MHNGWEDLSPKTVRDYERIYRTTIRSSIGEQRITATNSYQVELFLRSLAEKGLGTSGVRPVRAILSSACRSTSKWSGGELPNPVAMAELPKPKVPSTPVRAPGLSEVKGIIEAAQAGGDVRMSCFVRLLAATGMRLGEACAFRFSDINETSALLRVDRSVVNAKGGAIVKVPKTRASVRTVALDETTLGAIRILVGQQRQVAEDCGVEIGQDGFFFFLHAWLRYSAESLRPFACLQQAGTQKWICSRHPRPFP
ncbi:MAG: tyrosine-type recombinase/integrase [Actinomycetota bacterium]|nr:tyrosine-type recombinase/integrase [Actinomycetota bacterium]